MTLNARSIVDHDHDVLAVDPHLMHGCRLDCRHAQRLARPNVEASPVTRALHLEPLQRPLDERPAGATHSSCDAMGAECYGIPRSRASMTSEERNPS